MISLYNSYLADNLNLFSDNLCKYDFLDYDPRDESLIQIWKSSVNFFDRENLRSNGSSDLLEEYKFGPMSVLTSIERILKYRQYHTILLVGNLQGRNELIKSQKSMQEQVMYFDYRNPDWKPLITAILGRRKSVIKGQPNTFLYLTSDDAFLSILERCNRQIHSICTTDWEPFFRKKKLQVLVNDNMINWKTGINFYTCENGYRHFLPIFFLSDKFAINMLNNANKRLYVNDDIFTYDSTPIACGCGKTRLNFDIAFHCNNSFRVDMTLIEELIDKYMNLQFERKENDITCYFTTLCGKMSAHDEEIIRHKFGDIKFVSGIRLLTGLGKYYPFWESSSRTISMNYQ